MCVLTVSRSLNRSLAVVAEDDAKEEAEAKSGCASGSGSGSHWAAWWCEVQTTDQSSKGSHAPTVGVVLGVMACQRGQEVFTVTAKSAWHRLGPTNNRYREGT